MNYGKAIKTIRTLRGISQTELADRTSFSKSYLSKIEAGTSNPTLETLEAIAGKLKVPFYLLMFFSTDNSDVKSIPAPVSDEIKKHLFDMVLAIEEKERGHDKRRASAK